MSTTIAKLIENLKAKDPATEVEFVVCKTDGELVTVDVQEQAKAMIKMLKMFSG